MNRKALHPFLFKQVSIHSLVVFRVVFGFTMLWEVYRYFKNDWIREYYIDPLYNFTYGWFSWVQPWPGDGMYYHFAALGLLSLCIALGLLYRISTVLFFLGFSYVFLLEQARYLNHFYLVVLISFLLIFLPAHRYWSLDGFLFANRDKHVPAWCVLLLRLQLGIVYFYGGVAKLNADWLQGQPMGMWLAERTEFPFVGHLFTEKWMVYFFSYGGLFLDLLAFPLLMIRKTRLPMFLALVLFHFTNDRLFVIGIFPWFAIAATTIFFAYDWPLRVLRYAKEHLWTVGGASIGGAAIALLFHGGLSLFPLVVGAVTGALVVTSLKDNMEERDLASITAHWKVKHHLVVYSLACWFMIQVLLPLRHFAVPGDVNWTEEGHRFSWHMKLRDKSGKVMFYAIDPGTGDKIKLDPKYYLTAWQYRKMATRPYLIQQFASYLQGILFELKGTWYAVTSETQTSLNGRTHQPLVDPGVDLTKKEYYWWKHNDWIMPLAHRQK